MAAGTGSGVPGLAARPPAGAAVPGKREAQGQPAAAARTGAKARRGPGRAMVIALVAVAVLGAAGGFAYSRFDSGSAARAVPSVGVSIGEFTTNLADADQRRVIQVDITLDVAGPAGEKAVKDHLPAVQDAINRTLRGFTSSDLAGPDGVDRLRAALRAAIDAASKAPVVRAVYFTRIVTQ